jgi:hypothetical protein
MGGYGQNTMVGMYTDMPYPIKRRKKKSKSKRGDKETMPLFPVEYGDDGGFFFFSVLSLYSLGCFFCSLEWAF